MTQVGYPPFAPVRCPDCGTELSPALLSCPVCRRLVHGERLNQLASWAKQAAETGNLAGALAAWREALTLLPPDSRQHATVSATVSALTREVDARGLKLAPAGPAPAPGQSTGPGKSHAGAKAAGAAGTLALLLWKLPRRIPAQSIC